MNITQPPEIFSSLSSLGDLIETFPLRKSRNWAWLAAALMLVTACAGATIYGIVLAYLGWKRYGAAVVGESLYCPLILAAVLFLSSLIFAGVAYANWAKVIVLYQNGFAYKDRRGLHPWRWRDVIALRMAVTRHDILGIHTGTTHTYTVENRNGNRFVLDDGFSRVEELARVIEENTFSLLFEQADQQFNAGRNLTFGPVMVNKVGIQFGRKSYVWDEVQQVAIQEGVLKISKKGGGWFSGGRASVPNIPNLRVLLSIIDQVMGIQTEK